MAGSVAAVTGRNAAVAGGGPVGAITALMLAKQGWQVQVQNEAFRVSA